MTQVAGDPRSDRPSTSRRHDICPFLLADSGWRSASPVKEHRCLALGADVPLALEKQKRLCLTAEHRVCPAYTTALGRTEAEEGASKAAPRWPYPRMAPVVLDHGRMSVTLPAAARDRPAGQLALGGLMLVAFAAIALARFGDSGEGGVAAVASTPSPEASVLAVAPSPTPEPTPAPTPTPSVAPASATPAPTPTPPMRTYTMKRGDTLIKVAARFETTVSRLLELNDIDDPARIPVGEVVKIPPEATGR
ncbi:MAG TPA: LysM domain-containing protein [Candidatus Limnocylindrales bacterium]|nr:LysM domain-containing protein [Candidatus Limnocylindrales bacterium]